MKVKEFFTDKTKWTQGCWARNKHGSPLLSYEMDEGVQFCLVGAVAYCYGVDTYSKEWIDFPILTKIHNYLKEKTKPTEFLGISFWNDQSDTSFEDVKRLVEELDI
jgi:hypothetical protein